MSDRKSEIASIKSAGPTPLSQVLIGWLGHGKKITFRNLPTFLVFIFAVERKEQASSTSATDKGACNTWIVLGRFQNVEPEVAALERTRRQDGLQAKSDSPLTPEFRNL